MWAAVEHGLAEERIAVRLCLCFADVRMRGTRHKAKVNLT